MGLHLMAGIRRAEKKPLWKSHGRDTFATARGRGVKVVPIVTCRP